LFPPFIMRAAVRQIEKQSTGLPVLYFHPWEFDLTQPKLPLGRGSRWRTYVGIKRSRSRLRRLLDQYRSSPLIEAVAEIEKSNVELPSFQLSKPTTDR
jgi:hypothetical protein